MPGWARTWYHTQVIFKISECSYGLCCVPFAGFCVYFTCIYSYLFHECPTHYYHHHHLHITARHGVPFCYIAIRWGILISVGWGVFLYILFYFLVGTRNPRFMLFGKFLIRFLSFLAFPVGVGCRRFGFRLYTSMMKKINIVISSCLLSIVTIVFYIYSTPLKG